MRSAEGSAACTDNSSRSRRNPRARRSFLLAACVALSTAGPLLAANKSYVGPSGGDWDTAANWSPTGIPVGGDTALVEPSSAKTITYDGSYTSGNPLADLTLGGIPSTLSQTSGTLDVTSDNIEAGTFSQSAGFQDVLGTLTLGFEGQAGTVVLSAGALDSLTTQLGDQSGNGIFTQNGTLSSSSLGTLVLGNLAEADGQPATGTITLSAGTLIANTTALGNGGGAGTFIENGSLGVSNLGTLTIGTSISVGEAFLSAGSLTSNVMLIGTGAAGTFNQSGGASRVGTLVVGVGAPGTVLFSAGTLAAADSVAPVTSDIGAAGGSGTFTQNGSLAFSNLGTLLVGVGPASSGTVLLSAGSLTANTTPGETGAVVGDGGTALFNQSGGSSSLGNLIVGQGTSSNGTVSLTAGTLVAATTVLGDGGNATFTQNGSLAVSNLGGLTVGLTSVGDLYLQQGSLTAGITNIGAGGSAIFSQSGGSSSLGAFAVGDGSSAAADFNGGTLAATYMIVGQLNPGVFNQYGSSSTANFGSCVIGQGAAGTLNLSAGTLNVTSSLDVGDGAAGTFNQTGGLSNVGNLNAGISGATGTILLSGGSLSANQTILGYTGPAIFSQTGGSSSLGSVIIAYGSGATGTISLSAGTLTASQMDVGASNTGAATFNQTGGSAVIAGDLTVGGSVAGPGTISLNGGTFTAQSTVEVGSGGPGTITVGVAPSFASLGAVEVNSNGTIVVANNGTLSTQTLNNSGYMQVNPGGTLLITGGGSLNGAPLGGGSVVFGAIGTGTASIIQTGGISNLGAVTVAVAAGSNTDVLSISGGSLTASTVLVGPDSDLSQSGGSSSLGTLEGAVNLTGGTLTATATTIGSTFVVASFQQSGSLTYSSLGTLVINDGSAVGILGGSGSLGAGTMTATATTLGVGIGSAAITQGGAYFSQNAPRSLSSLGTLTVGSVGVVQLSNGTMQVPNLTSAGTLDIFGGTLAIIGQGSHGTSSISIGASSTLSINGQGVLDLGTSALVISYTGTSPIGELNPTKHPQTYPANTIQRYLQTAVDNGNWDGPGISSSNAEADFTGVTAVGALDNNDLLVLQGNNYTGTTWMGQPITSNNMVLVRYTYYGDTNLDGHVDAIDVDNLVQGFEGFGDGWLYGDFNYDGIVDSLDVTEMIIGYTGQGKPLGDAISPGQAQFLLSLSSGLTSAQIAKFEAVVGVPEPASIGLLGAIAASLLARRRHTDLF